ncbi:MAG: anaerobic ribonucleoside-triphosphate reductase [Victivallales bacterium]|nr:anaerobic ribonucleoside-triphosphate reductase [Victivallales bacterium]
MTACPFQYFRKRDGLLVPFRPEKIAHAILKAGEAAARQDGSEFTEELANQIADKVVRQLNNPSCEYYTLPDADGNRIPHLEDVQDMVEITLAENRLPAVVAAYKRYRKIRERARNAIHVRPNKEDGDKGDLTDQSLLLVKSASGGTLVPWDRSRIAIKLIDKLKFDEETANSIAKEVENQIISSNIHSVGTELVRELVNNVLIERGYRNRLEDLSLYHVPREFIESLMYTKPTENSNIVSNNPEAVNLSIAELVLKQWGLDTIFSEKVKEAHDTGAIHLHDLGYPHRVYCSSHSIEYIKKYGLRDLSNLNTESNPARSASVLTGHLNTFLASMQANYAGALGIAYINIFYAPYLVGLSQREVHQVAQELIFNGSQNAFSRGGQTLFLDFNIHTGVPKYLKSIPAIGPGGKYMLRRKDGTIESLTEVLRNDTDNTGNHLMDLFVAEKDGTSRLVLHELYNDKNNFHYDEAVEKDLAERGEHIMTYGDYSDEAQRFTSELLKVWGEGDRNGRVFEFPKCDFHISAETFTDPKQYQIFMEACELSSKNGSTYFIFDRDEVTLSACCRLRTTIDDNRMLKHPECMRFCGFQNVTINIPQAAFRASRKGQKNLEGLLSEIDDTMEIAVNAHLQKKAKIAEMLSGPGRPLWQIGRIACDGRPYVELDKATYIIGLIGVNDAVKFLIGKELHESKEAFDMGLKIVSHMYLRAKEYSKKYNLKFTLEESPAESAARRLAKTDLVFFRNEAADIVKGANEDVAYYTNSIHLAAEAPVCLVERIEKQAMFHSIIESGAIIHAFIGEEQPSPEAIAALIKEVFFRTQSAQVTLSPEFTYCQACGHKSRGLQETCQQCGSKDVVGETRVVGYFSKIQNWNKSKRYGELVARQKGRYSVMSAN